MVEKLYNLAPKEKGWMIADEGGWLPGVYESEEAARQAFTIKSKENWGILQRLQDESDGTISLQQLNEAIAGGI
ncbi:hypothetical protein [Erwinia phyllosphaerae]|uniref:hypothetical protein n=1 Tax=Erwinia phyllosphaerae TaxID=2853256 RepID=UPI001FEF3FC8|nr:hypothetical protein [Erwinia phyllosphaerae]MBV4365906.1 hypothetical protein [Erwinia phyllosphaerae]